MNLQCLRAIFLLEKAIISDSNDNNNEFIPVSSSKCVYKSAHQLYLEDVARLNRQHTVQLVLSRRYSTVERRLIRSCQQCGHGGVNAIPMDGEFARMLDEEKVLGLHHQECVPVISLGDKSIWPVIMMEASGIYFVAIPAVCPHGEERSVEVNAAITSAWSFLLDIRDFVVTIGDGGFTPTKLTKLKTLLKFVIPFGRYGGVRPEHVQQLMKTGSLNVPSFVAPGTTIPCWKPHILSDKRRPLLTLNVIEHLRYVTYGLRKGARIADGCTVSGAINCRADIIGLPQITINLHALDGISGLRFHQCVDSLLAEDGRVVRFEPPLGDFRLASYMLGSPERMPFLAHYDVQRVNDHQLMVNFSFLLGHSMDRGFEYAYASLNFKNQGLLVGMEQLEYFPPELDIPVLDTQGSTLVWKLGEAFLHHKCGLRALLTFDRDTAIVQPSNTIDDPSMSGVSCCAEIRFECPGYTLSGLNLLPTDIKVCIPNFENQESLLKLVIQQAVVAKLVVWNQSGRVLQSKAPPDIEYTEASERYNEITSLSPNLRNILHTRASQLEQEEKAIDDLRAVDTGGGSGDRLENDTNDAGEASGTKGDVATNEDDDDDSDDEKLFVVEEQPQQDEEDEAQQQQQQQDVEEHANDRGFVIVHGDVVDDEGDDGVVGDVDYDDETSHRDDQQRQQQPPPPRKRRSRLRKKTRKERRDAEKEMEMDEVPPPVKPRNKTLEERLNELIPTVNANDEERANTMLRQDIFASASSVSQVPPTSFFETRGLHHESSEVVDDVDTPRVPPRSRSKPKKKKKRKKKKKPEASELYEFLKRVRDESQRKKAEEAAEREELKRRDRFKPKK